jgi:hypothetical protein
MMTRGDEQPGDLSGSEAILIDLGSFDTQPVRPDRSRWTALLLAMFTGLTCLGLTATAVVPRLIDRAADRGEPSRPPGPAVSAPSGDPAPAVSVIGQASIGMTGPVVATAHLQTGRDGRVVRVTGAAAALVGKIDVTLRLAGRSVARRGAELDAGAAIPATIGTAQVGIVSWKVDLPLSDPAMSDRGDGRALVEISWGPSSLGPAGSAVIVVTVGDGRSSG